MDTISNARTWVACKLTRGGHLPHRHPSSTGRVGASSGSTSHPPLATAFWCSLTYSLPPPPPLTRVGPLRAGRLLRRSAAGACALRPCGRHAQAHAARPAPLPSALPSPGRPALPPPSAGPYPTGVPPPDLSHHHPHPSRRARLRRARALSPFRASRATLPPELRLGQYRIFQYIGNTS